MLGQPKQMASLSSGLLARKGQARPAMRPQGFTGLEDLGWNDMGQQAQAVPPVLAEREVLREQFEAPPKIQTGPAEPVAVSPIRAERIARATKQDKAAFTLRLDADRHLRLRLASAVRNASSQQLVTEALDAFLATLPEVDTLVDQLPARLRTLKS